MTLPSRAVETGNPPVVVGYLPEYRLEEVSPEALKPLTDLVFFGLELPADGRLKGKTVAPEVLEKLRKIKRVAHCRLLICVGGWNRSAGFPAMAGNDQFRQQFVQDLFQFCQKNGFDGADLDWEHPKGVEELAAYQSLLAEAKKKFKPAGLLVTVAQAGWQDLGAAGYRAVDRVHLMSYDHDFPHATLSKTRQDVERLLAWGCPSTKIAVGLPFYGRNKERGALSYRDLIAGQKPDPDQDEINGYAFNGRATLLRKVALAREKKLAGVMIWEVGQDDPREEVSLLRAIADGIGQGKGANPQ